MRHGQEGKETGKQLERQSQSKRDRDGETKKEKTEIRRDIETVKQREQRDIRKRGKEKRDREKGCERNREMERQRDSAMNGRSECHPKSFPMSIIQSHLFHLTRNKLQSLFQLGNFSANLRHLLRSWNSGTKKNSNLNILESLKVQLRWNLQISCRCKKICFQLCFQRLKLLFGGNIVNLKRNVEWFSLGNGRTSRID